jgi:hypothetical protein
MVWKTQRKTRLRTTRKRRLRAKQNNCRTFIQCEVSFRPSCVNLTQLTLPVPREDLLDMLNSQTRFGRYLIRYLVGAQRSAHQDEEDVEGSSMGQARASRRQKRALEVEPFKQSQAGIELMRNGTFGATDPSWGNSRPRKRRFSQLLLSRELAHDAGGRGKRINPLIAQVQCPACLLSAYRC